MYDSRRRPRKSIDWLQAAKDSLLPTFPVRVSWNGTKWEKKPTCPHGHKDASWKPETIPGWEHANGFGVPCGQIGSQYAIYCLDIDSYKDGGAVAAERWIADHNVPTDTRTHRTISGGKHLIYQLPKAHMRLPSRSGIVPGLDSRGQGGWICRADGYEVLNDAPPVLLPTSACEVLAAGHSGGEAVDAPAYVPPEEGAVDARLREVLVLYAKKPRRGQWEPTLIQRWKGIKGRGDTTASARDMSLASLLVLHGLGYEEIVFILLNRFRHGVAARDGVNPVTERAAMRCAAKAVAHRETEKRAAALMPAKADAIKDWMETLT